MKFLVKNRGLLDLRAIERERILRAANACLQKNPVHITDLRAPMSQGGPNDYYSDSDYWWPDPAKPDGLPFVRRDGESYPGVFSHHRMALREVRTTVATLAAAYYLTGAEEYAGRAVVFLKEFFLDEATRMNPSLLHAQAVRGRTPGRGVGVIDTLHLAEVPVAIGFLERSPHLTPEIHAGLKRWFAGYLHWMSIHPQGVEEMNAKNNHGVCWFVQAALFARFTGDNQKVAFCRERYETVLLPGQMAADGSFPLELARTKPYGYSIFVLDNMATLCHVLSTPGDDLWEFELSDGRGIRKGLDYLYPYLEDKSKWPLPPDVQHFEAWPVRQPLLLFGGYAFGKREFLDLWKRLAPDPTDMEIRRNVAIRQPLLWVME